MRARRVMTAMLTSSAVLGLLVLLGAPALWLAHGGRWYDVTSPSMGRAAPVGTLLLTQPTSIDRVAVGDLVTFRSPGGTVYTHRVVARSAAGLSTRGDINPVRDSWRLHQRDLLGKVVYTVPGAGWAMRAIPLLLAGAAVVWLLTLRLSRPLRASMRVTGASWTLGLVSWHLHPWVGLDRMGATAATVGADVRVVSTVLLPVKATAGHGPDWARLISGASSTIHVTRPSHRGAYLVLAELDLGLWSWVALGAACLTPLVWCLVVGLEAVTPDDEPDDEVGDEPGDGHGGSPDDDEGTSRGATHRSRRRLRVAPLLIAALAGVAPLAGLPLANGALTTTIQNTVNTRATSIFRCAAATRADSAYFVYPFAESDGSVPAADVSGNNRPGTYRYINNTSYRDPGPCPGDGGRSITFDGTSNSGCVLGSAITVAATQPYSEEIWFRTTTTRGGYLIGYANSPTGASSKHDRILYMTDDGKLTFGVWTGSARTISSTGAYNDGRWHQAVATFAASGTYAGIRLYVDGAQVAADATITSAEDSGAGYIRIGYDEYSAWPNYPTNIWFTGSVAFASVYLSTLTPTRISAHYVAGS